MTTVETLQDLARSHIQIHAKGTGGNTKFTCEHCGKQFTGSLTRQLAHLVGESGNGIAACQDISDDILKLFQSLKVLPHPPRRPGENRVRRCAHPVRPVRVRRTRTSATMFIII